MKISHRCRSRSIFSIRVKCVIIEGEPQPFSIWFPKSKFQKYTRSSSFVCLLYKRPNWKATLVLAATITKQTNWNVPFKQTKYWPRLWFTCLSRHFFTMKHVCWEGRLKQTDYVCLTVCRHPGQTFYDTHWFAVEISSSRQNSVDITCLPEMCKLTIRHIIMHN